MVEGMNVHLSEDKEVISVRSQQLSIVAIMRLSTVDSAHCSAMQYKTAYWQWMTVYIEVKSTAMHDIKIHEYLEYEVLCNALSISSLQYIAFFQFKLLFFAKTHSLHLFHAACVCSDKV